MSIKISHEETFSLLGKDYQVFFLPLTPVKEFSLQPDGMMEASTISTSETATEEQKAEANRKIIELQPIYQEAKLEAMVLRAEPPNFVEDVVSYGAVDAVVEAMSSVIADDKKK